MFSSLWEIVSKNKRHHTFPYFADASKKFRQANAVRVAIACRLPHSVCDPQYRALRPASSLSVPYATKTREIADSTGTSAACETFALNVGRNKVACCVKQQNFCLETRGFPTKSRRQTVL
jgi:hypothetical protein